ncbi:hypothetical protein H311_03965 [Anncaliia algerae PRA109]|nr:hypothetical protein H311_03965 [Anncaliia algerae PRA109]
MHYFVRYDQRQDELLNDLEIDSSVTIVDWKNLCREICCSYFMRNPVMLGGPGIVVEMDESSLVRRKYEHGRIVNTHWVFGAYPPSSKEGFLFAVPNTRWKTLLPIIQAYSPGFSNHLRLC